MPLISFETVSADLSMGAGEYESGYPWLSFRVQLSKRESMKLSSGDEIGDLDGRVTILPDTEEPQDDGRGVGELHYFEADGDDISPFPPRFIIQVALPLRQYDELLSVAKLGRIPSEIMVEVKGMEYDWQPDGSGKKWDNKAKPKLPVSSVRFQIPLVLGHDQNDLEPPTSERAMPAARFQLDQLTRSVEGYGIEINKTLRRIFWSVLIVGSLLVFARW